MICVQIREPRRSPRPRCLPGFAATIPKSSHRGAPVRAREGRSPRRRLSHGARRVHSRQAHAVYVSTASAAIWRYERPAFRSSSARTRRAAILSLSPRRRGGCCAFMVLPLGLRRSGRHGTEELGICRRGIVPSHVVASSRERTIRRVLSTRRDPVIEPTAPILAGGPVICQKWGSTGARIATRHPNASAQIAARSISRR